MRGRAPSESAGAVRRSSWPSAPSRPVRSIARWAAAHYVRLKYVKLLVLQRAPAAE